MGAWGLETWLEEMTSGLRAEEKKKKTLKNTDTPVRINIEKCRPFSKATTRS